MTRKDAHDLEFDAHFVWNDKVVVTIGLEIVFDYNPPSSQTREGF